MRGRLPLAYGATLIALRVTGASADMIQIGDGDLLAGFADDRIERPLAANEWLFGEETYSLCLDDAEHRFRGTEWRYGAGRVEPDFFLLSTDGVFKSLAGETEFRGLARRLRTLALRDWSGLCDALPGWLASLSARGSADDCTLCLAVRPR